MPPLVPVFTDLLKEQLAVQQQILDAQVQSVDIQQRLLKSMLENGDGEQDQYDSKHQEFLKSEVEEHVPLSPKSIVTEALDGSPESFGKPHRFKKSWMPHDPRPVKFAHGGTHSLRHILGSWAQATALAGCKLRSIETLFVNLVSFKKSLNELFQSTKKTFQSTLTWSLDLVHILGSSSSHHRCPLAACNAAGVV